MGEKSDAKLMYSINGKSFHGLSEAPELTLDVPEDEIDDAKNVFKGGEMTVTGDINRLAFFGVFMDELALICYYQSIKSNNWLRIHRYPMRRKVR